MILQYKALLLHKVNQMMAHIACLRMRSTI